MNRIKETYILKSIKTGYVHSKFEVSVRCEAYIEGVCYAAVGWGSDGTPVNWEFVADTYCKADACTHWHFFGEDYHPESKYATESYYDNERIKQIINLVLDGYEIEKVDDVKCPE